MKDFRTSMERLTDAVNELTQPREHREGLNPDMAPIDVASGKHIHGAVVTRVASLLDQLELAVEPSGSTVAGHRVPTSTPAARMDAINALLVIDTEVSQQVGLYLDTERPTLVGNLRALVGLALELGPLDQKALARFACRWHTMAAIVTGWEVPPRALHNTCPLCTSRGTLRVRVDTNTGSGTGLCLECQETWDETTMGLLAEHVRAENREDGGVASQAHRTLVIADNTRMQWMVSCFGCEWEQTELLKWVALNVARAHRGVAPLEATA